MSVLEAFVAILLFSEWIIVICGCFMRGIDSDGGVPQIAWFVAAFLALSVPLAFVLAYADRDDHAGLCLRGHEVWVSNGKTRSKHWTCEEWEAQ